MEDKILNNLKALRAIKPENTWKQGLKSQLFDTGDSQEKLVSRGFLLFGLKDLKLAPALIPVAVVALVLVGVFLPFRMGQAPQKTAEQVNYFVLLETRLDEINTPEDIQGLVSIIEQASDTLSDTAKSPEQAAELAKSVAKINKKVEQIEKDFGEEAKDLKDSAQVLTAKTAEVLGQGIEDSQKELVAGLIRGYESTTLSNPQVELLNQAKEYYNNGQFESAFETILKIGK